MDSKISPFIEEYKDLLQKIREGMFGGLSFVLTCKAIFKKSSFRTQANSANRLLVGLLVNCICSQNLNMFQQDKNSLGFWCGDIQIYTARERHRWTRSLENVAMSLFQWMRTGCESESI